MGARAPGPGTRPQTGLQTQGDAARLRADTRVRFLVTPEDERSIGVYFDVVLKNGGLEIMGSESVIVKPRVSNVVEVRHERG